ncbi:uncharacterized protein LOC120437095 isoform X2 [Oreochromis aureus]|uniref:uncharacterized protein LOC120437095 isoform X2 n=1 Tax=Oreochromis aureus TaxID=47969 RepID=UPI0019549D64|nr:uncharacterized protein LOC120437095 isoform X2 [Oreochromis aureus]
MASFKFFLFLSLISDLTAFQQDVQVKLGDDVTLQCQVSTDEIISVLKWSRADLNTDGYVYFYRNKRSYENYQHPSFHGRVKLRDPEMKDGDVSLILKKVTFNDTGIYECHVAVRNPVRSKRVHTEISRFINLTVTGETHESVSEKRVVERGDADENMDGTERVGAPSLQFSVTNFEELPSDLLKKQQGVWTLSVDNFSILMIRRVFEGFRDPSDQQYLFVTCLDLQLLKQDKQRWG